MRTISRNLLIIVCKQAIFSLRLLPQFLACKFSKLVQLLLKFSSQEKPGEKSFKIVYICPTQFKTIHWWLLLASEWSDRHNYQGKCIRKLGMFGHTYVILYFDPHIFVFTYRRVWLQSRKKLLQLLSSFSSWELRCWELLVLHVKKQLKF